MNGMSSARYWAVAAAVGACLLAVPGTASADPLPADCKQPDNAGPVTCTYTAGSTTLVLPTGVSSVQITAIGGRGGNVLFTSSETITIGGRSAVVTATVPVTERTLTAVVGENGGDTGFPGNRDGVGVGGANGGGNSGPPLGFAVDVGGGGGGASDVRSNPTDLTSRLLVAGGGGGASALTEGASH